MTSRRGTGPVKVMFVIGLMAGGGAERVVVRILKRLDRTRFRPVLLLLEKRGSFLADVPEDVPVMDCGRYAAGGRLGWFRNFAGFLRQEEPDVVASFLWFPNAIAVLARFLSGLRCRLVLSERLTIDGSREGFVVEFGRRAAIRLLYPAADRIVPNSEATGRQLVERYRIPARKVVVIQNPVDVAAIRGRAADGAGVDETADGRPLIVGMGRLVSQKGFDVLIRALAHVKASARLSILGEGPDEAALRDLARQLGVSDRVRFEGFLSNPYPLLGRASVFVLPSRYEGFPNALVEAMALGVPCVATRCPTGPEEIVADGANGLLVPVGDPKTLAASIDRLLGDAALRDRLGEAAKARAAEYDAAGIVRRYESLLEEVCT